MKVNVKTHLTLKRAAEQLGVHEQTLRGWEKRGLIRLVRLPGSQYRRVPLAEIERLQASMGMNPAVSNVRLAPPKQDAEAVAMAQTLAEVVRAELATFGLETDLDQLMRDSRGRTWSP